MREAVKARTIYLFNRRGCRETMFFAIMYRNLQEIKKYKTLIRKKKQTRHKYAR